MKDTSSDAFALEFLRQSIDDYVGGGHHHSINNKV
jgi:hypothetical protein